MFLRLSCIRLWVLGFGFSVGERQNIFQYVKTHMHMWTHTHTKHFHANMLSLPTSQSLCYGYIWFSFNLCCPPRSSVSHPSIVQLRLLSSLSPDSATKALCRSFSAFPLSILSIYLFSVPSIHSYFSFHFAIIVVGFFFFHCFSLSFFLCLFFCHFLLPCITHALYLYLSSRSIPVCVFFFFPSLLFVSFLFSFFDPLFHSLLSPESLLVFKQHFSVSFLFIIRPRFKVHLDKEDISTDFSLPEHCNL